MGHKDSNILGFQILPDVHGGRHCASTSSPNGFKASVGENPAGGPSLSDVLPPSVERLDLHITEEYKDHGAEWKNSVWKKALRDLAKACRTELPRLKKAVVSFWKSYRYYSSDDMQRIKSAWGGVHSGYLERWIGRV